MATPTTSSANPRCFYEILNVERDATTDSINAAYRKLARQHHPDRFATKSDDEKEAAAERFKQVSAAHEVLSDPVKRKRFDLYGHEEHREGDGQGLWEEMMGLGQSAAKRKQGVTGGALFVDGSGHFFQRHFEDVDAMREEMKAGFPVIHMQDKGTSYAMRASCLPRDVPWEVKLTESGPAENELTVTLGAGSKADDEAKADAEWHSIKQRLRIERTFEFPADADVQRAVVVLDDERGMLSVMAPKKHVVLMAAAPTPHNSPRQKITHERRRRRGDGMRAGFLNAKPKGHAQHMWAQVNTGREENVAAAMNVSELGAEEV